MSKKNTHRTPHQMAETMLERGFPEHIVQDMFQHNVDWSQLTKPAVDTDDEDDSSITEEAEVDDSPSEDVLNT